MITEYRRIKQAELDRMIKEAIKNRNRKGLDSNIPERYKGYTFNDLLEYKYNQDITQITINKFEEIEKILMAYFIMARLVMAKLHNCQ